MGQKNELGARDSGLSRLVVGFWWYSPTPRSDWRTRSRLRARESKGDTASASILNSKQGYAEDIPEPTISEPTADREESLQLR
jgi:hypothetical protein